MVHHLQQTYQEFADDALLSLALEAAAPMRQGFRVGLDRPFFRAPFDLGASGRNTGVAICDPDVCVSWLSSASSSAAFHDSSRGTVEFAAASVDVGTLLTPIQESYELVLLSIEAALNVVEPNQAHVWGAVGQSFDALQGCAEQLAPPPAFVRVNYEVLGYLDAYANGVAGAKAGVDARFVPYSEGTDPMKTMGAARLVSRGTHFMNGYNYDSGGFGIRRAMDTGPIQREFLQQLQFGPGGTFITLGGVVRAESGPPFGAAFAGIDFHAVERLRLNFIEINWLDGSPPMTSLTLDGTTGNFGWWRSDVPATLRAVDPETCVTELQYSLDSAPWTKVDVDPFDPQVSFPIAGDGIHTIDYYARNGEGDSGEPQRLEVRIDKTPPAVALTTPRSGYCYIQDTPLSVGALTCATGTLLTLRASANDATSGVRHVEFHGQGPVGIDTAQPYSSNWNLLHALGWRTPQACAEDIAGNRACHTGPETLLVP